MSRQQGYLAIKTIKLPSSFRLKRSRWQGTALIVEALIILIAVVACLAVFVRLFGYAFTSNAYDQHRAHAITLASNQAERFAAQTSTELGTFTEEADGFTTVCTTTSTPTERGILYSATITVAYEDTPLYELHTARYASYAGSSGEVSGTRTSGTSGTNTSGTSDGAKDPRGALSGGA